MDKNQQELGTIFVDRLGYLCAIRGDKKYFLNGINKEGDTFTYGYFIYLNILKGDDNEA